MLKRKRGYRKHFKRPPKGCKPYKGKEPWSCSSHLNEESSHERTFSSMDAKTHALSTTKENNVQLTSSHTPETSDCGKDFLGWDIETIEPLPGQDVPYKKKALKVLSLFDGISCGLVALQCLGLDIEAYFSSELNNDSISVQKYHFFDKLTPLGCVTSLHGSKLESLGEIDLLLAGPPCNDLSIVNPNRRGLQGSGSSGLLFFDFVRIWKHFLQRAEERGTTLFWMLENTAAMENHTRAEISSALACQPVMRCASDYVGMRRPRFFWGNIPMMEVLKKGDLTVHPHLQNALRPYRTAAVKCLPTVTTSVHSQRTGRSKTLPVIEEGQETLLLITEIETLFGLPEHFTDVGNMSISRRRRLLGRAWCVPVIEDLLKPLVEIFIEK